MAKLVDALLSGGSAARCAGSSPVLGTNFVRGGDNCPVGEIGRHAILRGWFRKVCWFESSPGHKGEFSPFFYVYKKYLCPTE